ncbi:cupin domain-containing protein [Labedaea rhizosphaerae]|uniref:Cupin domain n=1 Tax=Labedaea rhizosphaerae TaxID=598644 RepID=A0A4R6SN88_LABRH|nr:cupin domain-containing protein [Labedaea rhizosphaerae]TDQ05464.1 cupin domain [Labedaea rhizosphaerae]
MPVIKDFTVITTPNATMTTFAAPSLGSEELSAWKVVMAEGASGPEHVIDREQVWLPVSGSLTVTVAVGEESTVVGEGQSLVLPAGVSRRISAPTGPVEAVVCMRADATVTANGESRPLPWAQ